MPVVSQSIRARAYSGAQASVIPTELEWPFRNESHPKCGCNSAADPQLKRSAASSHFGRDSRAVLFDLRLLCG